MPPSEPQRNVSNTARAVAMLRVAHQMLDAQPKILDDPISGPLMGDEMRQWIATHAGWARDPGTMASRAYAVLRSRYAEDRLAKAVRRGVRQYVILGAGFDTFAYRQPEWAGALRIFEVDHQGTQTEKRQGLEKAGISTPTNLEFVAIDFESVSLREGLGLSSLDFSQPTFFSCLGVLVYLTKDAAGAIFQLVAEFPTGSEIAFTFTKAGPGPDLAKRMRALGETVQTHFDPNALRRDLRALGFSEVSVLKTDEAKRMYFRGRNDGLKAPPDVGIAAAVVGSGKR